MFYACLVIMSLLLVMCFCIIIAVIDLETYNFGLYIVLLCIVGTMLACALCIANPNACANPAWYSRFCLLLQEMYPDHHVPVEKTAGLKRIAMQAASTAAAASTTGDETKLPLRQESRATVAMLAPAVHIMHQVWKGMAWVADGIDEDDEHGHRDNQNGDMAELGQSTSGTASLDVNKRLSTIAETSCVHDQEESSEFDPFHDVTL